MNPERGRYAELLTAAEQGVQIVTASRRLARDLRARYDERQLATGSRAWKTASILPIEAWLSRLADLHRPRADVARRLNPLASQLLWDDCFMAQLPADISNPSGLARQSFNAWRQIQEWCVPLDVIERAASSRDERTFAAAARTFHARLQAENWLDPSCMQASADTWIAELNQSAVSPCVFAGFERPNPATLRIMQALGSAATVVKHGGTHRTNTPASLAEFERIDAEYRAAGAWARKCLEQQPAAHLAIICPTLEVDADAIAGHIRDGFVPGWQFGPATHRTSVNVSYGRKLADLPAINIGLLILRWASLGLTTREVSTLLRSRSFAGGDISRRVGLERALRQLPDRSWNPGELLETFRQSLCAPESGELGRVVGDLASLSERVSQPMPPAACMREIDAILMRAGWPGVTSPSSSEFQLINRWRELLNELATAEQVIPSVTIRTATHLLGRLAGETLWQPETTGDGRVQVLGVLEAAGMEFDGLWICGMDATQWPPRRLPSPFVPRSIQVEYGMPDASPAHTLEFCRERLHSLRASTDNCVISWSRNRDDGEVTASHLLDGLRTVPAAEIVDPGRFAARLTGGITVDPESDAAPPVTEDELVRGGAYTVQRQFTDPFSAFAFGRLGIRPIEPIPNGLSAAMRGNMIHDALHHLLAHLPDSREISSWTHEEQERRIGSAVDTVLAQYRNGLDAAALQILRLERERLRRLMFRYLAEERQRAEFAVNKVEHRADYRFEKLRLGIRIDRVDQLPDGRLLIIDYKTGQPRHFADRQHNLTDLQLVVYADALDAPIGGIAFINIDSREISYRTAGDGWRADESWNQTLNTWRTQLHEVLEQFVAGDVRVDTSQLSSTARPLAILSRFEEQSRDN